MRIGLVPVSAKPLHKGHYMLIELAAKSNDEVAVFISYSSRGTKSVKDPTDARPISKGGRKIDVPVEGDTPVFGSDMKYIWSNLLTPENLKFSSNVKIFSPDMSGVGPAPVMNVYKVCGAFAESYNAKEKTFDVPFLDIAVDTASTIINIYSDVEDIAAYDNENSMPKYGGGLWKGVGSGNKAPCIQGIGVSRTDTVDISGTKMRQMLKDGDVEGFIKLLPPVSDKIAREIFKILSQSAIEGVPLEKRIQTEALIRQYVRSIL